MIRDYQEGAKVMITKETFKHILNNSKSIKAYPSDGYLEEAKKMIGYEGTVTLRFKPGYEFNVEWNFPYEREDGTIQHVTILQVKDHWVEPIDDKWKEVK